MTQSPGWQQTETRVRRGPGESRSPWEVGGTYLPISWGGHSLGGCELERVHRSQDLVKVAPGGGGIEQRQLQPLVGTNNKHLKRAEEGGKEGGRGYTHLPQMRKITWVGTLAQRAVRGRPSPSCSSGSSMPRASASSRLRSVMMGKGSSPHSRSSPLYARMSW